MNDNFPRPISKQLFYRQWPKRLIFFFLPLIWFGYFSTMAAASVQNNTKTPSAITQNSIIILGDSLSAGYGLTAGSGWVNLLSRKLVLEGNHWKVINASISGETTSGGLRRLNKLLIQYQPKIVLIELGGNDGLRGFVPKITYQNLQKMIVQAEKHHAKVILAGVHLPPNYGKKYETKFYLNYVLLSRKYNLPLIPFILDGIAENKDLMQADGIHPKEQAQKLILRNVWTVLQPALSP